MTFEEAGIIATKIVKSESNKPPLGIIPRWLHEKQRIKALEEAINRYSKANYPIPDEWKEEYEELKQREKDLRNVSM